MLCVSVIPGSPGLFPSDREAMFWIYIFPLLAACASILVLAVLLCKLWRLPRACRGGNWFIRQLWHLAAADILYAIVYGSCNNLLPLLVSQNFICLSISSGSKSNICKYGSIAFMTGQYTSMALESHIALTFLLSIYRQIIALETLNRFIYVVWPLGLALSISDTMMERLKWDALSEDDFGCNVTAKNAILFPSTAALFVMTCLCCYIASARKVAGASRAVERRVWSRAQLYPIAFLLINGPIAMYLCLPSIVGVSTPESNADLILWSIVATLGNSNGVLLSFVYAAQRKYTIRGDRQTSVDFYVAFRDPESIAEVLTFSVDSSNSDRSLDRV